MRLTRGSGLDDVSRDGRTALIAAGPMQREGRAIPRNEGFSRRARGSLGRQKPWLEKWPPMSHGGTFRDDIIDMKIRKKQQYIAGLESHLLQVLW